LRAHTPSAGQRGFAILIGVDPMIGPYFVWQHRAVEKGREGDEQGPFELNVVTDTGLLFCPWCGTNLKRFYRGSAEQLVRPGFEVLPLRAEGGPRH
jgi:hypothetical protein